MALIGIPPPSRMRGLPDSTQRQFDYFYEWILRLVGFLGFGGLILPVRLFGATNAITPEHVNKYLIVSHSSACVLTLTAATLRAMPLGAAVYMVQAGTGQLTLNTSGVTVRTAETLKTRKQWSSMMLVKVDDTEAILNGDLELA